MDYKHHEDGFTFLHMYLTITILFMLIPLTITIMHTAKSNLYEQEIATEHFFDFLQVDVYQAVHLHVATHRIDYTTPDDRTITMEQFQHLVRRRIDRKGHEVYLRHVKNLTFHPLAYGFRVMVLTTKGEKYEKTIIFHSS